MKKAYRVNGLHGTACVISQISRKARRLTHHQIDSSSFMTDSDHFYINGSSREFTQSIPKVSNSRNILDDIVDKVKSYSMDEALELIADDFDEEEDD
jgi:hypothetical protein